MSTKKNNPKNKIGNSGLLPKMELLVILIFFLSFITWAMSKCNETQEVYQSEASQNSEIKQNPAPVQQEIEEKPAPRISALQKEKTTVLYVLLADLKLRKGPSLDSAIVRVLNINDEVYFLNETTSFKQKINLGNRIAMEPWIKVRAYSGHEGWVYGAGVHYYKTNITDTLGQ